MLTIKSLFFQNIGRFIEPQTIDFTQLGSLVQVEGQNSNTGGSSGAGKSTIFKALSWLLGLEGPSTTILQSRLTKEHIQVSATFDFDGQYLKVERGRKLTIELGGVVTTGSSKLTEEELDRIIGMPRALFSKILHKSQGSNGFFLQMGPSEVHKFLTSCLGLEKEQEKNLVLDSRLSALEKDRNTAFNGVQTNEAGLAATKESILILGPEPTLEISPETLEELKNSYSEASTNIALSAHAHKADMEKLEFVRPKIQTTPYDRSTIEQIESKVKSATDELAEIHKAELERKSSINSKISELQIEIGNSNNLELSRQHGVKANIAAIQQEISALKAAEILRLTEVRTQIASNKNSVFIASSVVSRGEMAKISATSLAKELQKVRESICPTCEQGWVNDLAKAKETDILTKLQEYKKEVISGINASKEALSLEKQRAELELHAQPRELKEIVFFESQITQLRIDAEPRIIPKIQLLNEKITQLRIDLQSQLSHKIILLNQELAELKQDLKLQRMAESDHQSKEDAKSQALLAEFAKKQAEVRESYESIVQSLRDIESNSLSLYQSAKSKVEHYESSLVAYSNSLRRLNNLSSHFQTELDARRVYLASVEEETELATESKKAIKSFLSCSFEYALESIGGAATRLIRSIPNMATATIQFEGLKETKEGKVKEEATCVVSMDGEIGIPVKSLSGGERSSTDIAIDLSIIKFIEETTGKGIDLCLLDEVTNGLDTQCIEDTIEMLKNSSLDKRLFLIEHNPIVSQAIENKITVVRDGLTSKVIQQ